MREPRFGNDGLDKYDLDPASEKHPPRLIVSDRPAEAMSHNDEESPAAPVFPVFAILVQVAEEFSN
jgi:hypothetical protein